MVDHRGRGAGDPLFVTEPGGPAQSIHVTGLQSVEQPRLDDFRAIYDAELPWVWNTLRRVGVPDRHLEDVAHDVFVVVYRRLDDYDRARPLRPWLFGIAHRVASDFRRRAAHAREIPDEEPAATHGGPDAEAQLADDDARAVVARALDTLDEDKRAVFVMHELDDRPVTEIADALAIPLNTAYSRLRLARRDFTAAVRRLRARGEA